ncbi:GNAT family N-acetyltransferase [Gryllotalpicola protaetiae]|uniref:GNAT family N-acetyltransferase n=1 Tax=Gryllotalpicola protaetiae TaxID=2419771 RepID=A0A387BJU6_9MICO|nr:GNAT family N-acetyltransferase [Gryllotalpicola protaetiae]AYG02434.1 GNAT family N-acetyltransferase [Gryllotalpicola protaetiae]
MTVEVLPATGHWAGFAEFMVPPGGAGGCVCMSYRDARLDMAGRVAHMKTECEREPGPGVLAYVDGQAAGWCSVAPKSTYRRLLNSRTIPHLDEERDPWAIVCFVVRPGFRRRGLMHELLDGAVEHARASGAELVEGYPADPRADRVDSTSGYVGTTALFEAHGFERVAPTSAHSGGAVRWLMRRELG